MGDLLDLAISAHGGIDRWASLSRLTARVSVAGGLWPAKGKAGILEEVSVEVECHRQHVEYFPFGADGHRSVYEPNRVAVESSDNRVLESRDNPRKAFASHVRETQWDNLDLVYFSGYAMWTYLTTPFLLERPGFQSAEIEPWNEGDEVWRRLKVIFPENVASHSAEQVFYFDKSGILTRHDYNADILGGVAAANYATEPREFSGLIIPTRRRVFVRRPDGQPVRDRITVAIDFHNIDVA
jgi:hypothetical protein